MPKSWVHSSQYLVFSFFLFSQSLFISSLNSLSLAFSSASISAIFSSPSLTFCSTLASSATISSTSAVSCCVTVMQSFISWNMRRYVSWSSLARCSAVSWVVDSWMARSTHFQRVYGFRSYEVQVRIGCRFRGLAVREIGIGCGWAYEAWKLKFYRFLLEDIQSIYSNQDEAQHLIRYRYACLNVTTLKISDSDSVGEQLEAYRCHRVVHVLTCTRGSTLLHHIIMNRMVLSYDLLKQHVVSNLHHYVPITKRLDRFESFLLLTLFLFFVSWLLERIYEIRMNKTISWYNFKKALFRIALKFPPARNLFEKQRQHVADVTINSIPPEFRSAILKIPARKPNSTNIVDSSQPKSLRGYLSGSRYPSKAHSDFVAQLSSRFIYSNPLHFNIHPAVRQMETEVIRMCAKMLGFMENGEAVGVFTSGGTESILLSILAMRQYGRKKGISKPNLLVCWTGHVASIKACKYFDIDIRFVDYDKDFCMSLSDMKSKIDNNTVGVYTSCPNYPYGTIDPIKEIGAYCKPRDIPVHIDMCLGGFLVPFLKNDKGEPIFTIPDGATSISIDPHKFGLAGKGSSVLLYSNSRLRRDQLFTTSCWPGGIYGTPGIAGSRSGVGIASSWISMMKMGMNGYKESAERVQSAVRKFAKACLQLGFKLYGKADICTIAFSHPKFPCNSIQMMMKKRQWSLSIIQKPILLHFSFTPLNSTRIDDMIKDLREVMRELSNSKQKFSESLEIQLYGACAKVPDDVSVEKIFKEVMAAFLDA